MVPNRFLPGGDESTNAAERASDDACSRRSYLRATGAAVAAGLTAGTASASAAGADGAPATGTADDASSVIDIDYDRIGAPSDAYRVWNGNEASAAMGQHPTQSGSQSLSITVGSGDSWGTNAMYWLPEQGYGQPSEAYQRQRVSISDGWEMAPDDLCRFTAIGFNTEAGNAGSGGRGPPTGADGWSSVVCLANRGNPPAGTYGLATYTYHMDYHSGSGEIELADAVIPIGEWVDLETYVRMNTYRNGQANSDGVIRYWLDGELAYEREDLRFTTTDAQGIEYLGPRVRYGGSEVAPTEQSIQYGDHRIVVGPAASDRAPSARRS
ncbi:hypothetical protein ACT4ML_00175 [Natrinema sp. LN54]|uniref:hypothetical protein n=1 Tax=Natrinema sp. LN54 TaxID=3458705 RepID=UPI004035AA2D